MRACSALVYALAFGGASGFLVVPAAPRAVGRPLPAARANHAQMARNDDDMEIDRPFGSTEDFGQQRRIEKAVYTVGGLITIIVPTVLAIWAYNEGYLTPQ